MKTKQDCHVVLHRLGIMEGDVVLIHHHEMLKDLVSQSATMIDALTELVGSEGTIVSYQLMDINQDPSRDPQISFDKRQRVREELMQFDLKKYREIYYDPTFLALTKVHGRQFNNHPRLVVCAVGKYASLLTKGHPLDFPFGVNSPFETLKQLNAKVLHFGEDYSDCHELRHGYSLAQIQSVALEGVVLGKEWVKYSDYTMDTSKYQEALEKSDTKEVITRNKKIQCFSYQEALNQFVSCHPILFKELGQ